MTDYLKRPARVQVPEEELPSNIPPQNGLVFNAWYNKWSHGTNSKNTQRYLNKYKCDPSRDSGYTRADKLRAANGGTTSGKSIYYCLYFAKGVCCRGSKCDYFHHCPTEEVSVVYDCFGREKFSDFRDDMGGVGSFNKQNKTLYIGGLTQGSGLPSDLSSRAIEERIKSNFEKYGDLDYIRYIKDKNCCFIKYRHQSCAEFAKEAMSHQTLLTKKEIDSNPDVDQSHLGIIVKWANDDPNPQVQKLEKEIMKRNALQKMAELFKEHNDLKRKQSETQASEDKDNDKEGLPNKRLKIATVKKQSIFSKDDIVKFQKRALRKKTQRPSIKNLLSIYDSD